jgi:hypothetical protein
MAAHRRPAEQQETQRHPRHTWAGRVAAVGAAAALCLGAKGMTPHHSAPTVHHPAAVAGHAKS